MPYLSLSHGRIWYAAHSTGADPGPPPLVLVHGAGGSRLDWPASLRRFPYRPTYTLDLPGHGRSDPPGRDSIAAYAADVRAWLDAMAIEQAVLCGHSMGGAICQVLALEHPARIAALVLVATGAKLRVNPTLLRVIVQDPDAAYDQVVQGLWQNREQQQVSRQRLAGIAPDVMRDDLLACNTFDLMDRVAGIDAPTLVVSGANDPMTPHKFGRYLAETIPKAALVTVPGAGHMVALEQPDTVAGAVADFLTEHEGA